MELNKIWDTFFFPVLDSVIAYVFFLALFGRKKIIRFREHLFPKKDGKYCRKVYQLSDEGKLISSYAPISQDFMDLLHKPIPLIVICLIGCLAFYRLLSPLSLLCPIHVGYASTTATLLDQVDNRTLAEIWSQYPNLDLDELITKVGLNRQASDDYSYIGEFAANIDLVIRFCATISFVRLALCTVCFLAVGLIIILGFSMYLTFSLPLVLKFVIKCVPMKLPIVSFPRLLKTVPSFFKQIRTRLLEILKKASSIYLQNLLSALRTLLLFAISVLLFFLSSFQIINSFKNQMAYNFLLEKIVESEKYVVSDEVLNDYLQKVQEAQNEQNDMRLYFVVVVGFPGYSRDITLNFNDFPPMMKEFMLNLEYG